MCALLSVNDAYVFVSSWECIFSALDQVKTSCDLRAHDIRNDSNSFNVLYNWNQNNQYWSITPWVNDWLTDHYNINS